MCGSHWEETHSLTPFLNERDGWELTMLSDVMSVVCVSHESWYSVCQLCCVRVCVCQMNLAQ